jgi:hypothetical protein
VLNREVGRPRWWGEVDRMAVVPVKLSIIARLPAKVPPSVTAPLIAVITPTIPPLARAVMPTIAWNAFATVPAVLSTLAAMISVAAS